MTTNISRTTLIGVLYGIVSSAAIDWPKVFDGDHHELARMGGVIIVGVLGKYAADQPKSGPGETEKRETRRIVPGENPLK